MTSERQGALLCLLTALVWSTTAIFSKLAYDAGVGVMTLVVVRNVVGAGCFWIIVAGQRRKLPPSAMLVRGLALGMVGSAVQTLSFATALSRIDAGLAAMLLYTYPAMVMIGAVLIGREQATRRRGIALLIASAGVFLVLSGSFEDNVDPIGIALVLGAALAYTVSVLIGHSMLRQMPPLVLAGLQSGGAAITFTIAALVTSSLSFDFNPWAWLALAGLALIPTLVGASTSLAGVSRIGPTRASILFTLEVPMTVLLAALLLGERLRLSQLVGGALVLAAIVLLQTRGNPFTRTRTPRRSVS